MDNSKGNQKSTKASPKFKKKSGDADAKEEPLESSKKKGPQEVDGTKNGKTLEAKKTSPGKDGKQEELENKNPEALPEQPNVESQDSEEPVPLPRVCPSCIEVTRRWPPPPYVDPNPRDPSLLYPGDVDLEFQPFRGDILIIHPGLHMGLADLRRELPKDGFVSCYDGSPSFQFAVGDLIVRMGTYDEKTTVEPTKKVTSKLGKKGTPIKGDEKMGQVKGKKNKEKKGGSTKQGGGKKGEVDDEKLTTIKPESCTYKPYEKLELYTCSGFITGEELARLEAERLAMEVEKERLKNESKEKGAKGKNDKKTKENAKGDGKKTIQGGDDKKKDTGGNNNKKKSGPKVPALGKEKVEKDGEKGNTISQEETLVEPAVVLESRPKPKWRYLGSQMQLDTKSQSLLEKQCPGLTYFYRRYMTPGTRCEVHSLTPVLGEILINIGWLNNWYKNLEKWQKEVNNYKSLVRWFTPGLPSREDLVPGMILLRPLVGRENANWVGWGLDGKKLAPSLLPQPLITQEDQISPRDPSAVADEAEIVPPPKCDCHRKSPCPKPPCPCHLYEPCPKLPNCGCIYCNPLPRKPKPIQPQENAKDEEEKDGKPGKGKGKNKNDKGKGKDGKNSKDEQPIKGAKAGVKKDGNNVKQQEKKVKSKDGQESKDTTKNLKGKSKDGKNSKTKEEEGKGDPHQELELPKQPYVWGTVEMYLFLGKEEGWEFWGRSNRICDTPYPLPSENAKPKFLHLDDRSKVVETLDEKAVKENVNTEEIGKESTSEKPAVKNSKQVVKDDVKLQQEKSVKKNTKKT